MKSRLLILALFAVACHTGSGSEIGPAPPLFATHYFSGQVLARDGSPVVGAWITLEDAAVNRNAATDSNGRFRIPNAPAGIFTMTVDGSSAAANGIGETFAKIQVRATVSGESELSFPIFLPSLTADANFVARKSIAIGSALTGADDFSIAGAGLNFVLNGAQAVWEDPPAHSGETTATVSGSILSSEQIPFEMHSSIDGDLNSAIAFWFDPQDLLFSTPASLNYSSTYFPNGASDVKLYRYNPTTLDWESTATASIAGGVITLNSSITRGGFFTIAAPVTSTIAITGRAIDEDGNPLPEIQVSAPFGKKVTTGADGTFSFLTVNAADGNGAGISATMNLVASTTQMRILVPRTLSLSPGTDLALGDITVRTVQAGAISLIVIRKGHVIPNLIVNFGADLAGFGMRTRTDDDGMTVIWDYPRKNAAVYNLRTSYLDKVPNPFRVNAGTAAFHFSDRARTGLYLEPIASYNSSVISSAILVRVVREDSETPVENAFVMLGLDPTTPHRGFTNSSGQISFKTNNVQTVTAIAQTLTPAGGGSFDVIRLTSAVTLDGVFSSSVVVRLPSPRRLGAQTMPYPKFGQIAGDLSSLTNPTVSVPTNPSGTYEVELTASPRVDARQLFPVMEEWSEFADSLPAGADSTFGYSSGGVLDGDYSKAAHARRATLVGIERDSNVSGSGAVTKFGLVDVGTVRLGQTTNADLDFGFSSLSQSYSLTSPGLDGALAGSLEATLGFEFPDTRGARIGEWTSQVSLPGSTGTVQVAPPSGALAGGTYWLKLNAEQTGGGATQRQSAFARSSGGAFSTTFLAVPTISTPTPGGSDFNPTAGGAAWTLEPGSNLTRLKVTSSSTVVDTGVTIRDDFEWHYFTRQGDSAAVFPTLPTTFNNMNVPVFFSSGKTYTLEVRNLQADEFQFDDFFTFAGIAHLWELSPVAESLYQTTSTIP